MFANHSGRVVMGVCAASVPALVVDLEGTQHNATGLRALICNYVLDVLPSAIVRAGESGIEQLNVRTHLSADTKLIGQYTRFSIDEIRGLADSPCGDDHRQLIALTTLLDCESTFLPIAADQARRIQEIVGDGALNERCLVNYEAFSLLARSRSLLACGGFVLLNDYGPVDPQQATAHAVAQRFGPTLAHGINFPLLERYLGTRNLIVSKPSGDDQRSIHSRLIAMEPLGETARAFENRFSLEAWQHFEAPAEQARKCLASGQKEAALNAYREALSRQPKNWRLVGEVGEFVALQLRDFQAGADLVRSAIERNPCYSSWLWNVLGDCLYCMERQGDAHEAYLQAARIDSTDPRACLNLAYTFFDQGDFDQAISMIAKGLSSDLRGQYREKLVEKQTQILNGLSARTQAEDERLYLRLARLHAA